ncbi:MAG: hypothetical protein ABJL44_18630 [Algibacter sp.]
MVNKIEFLENLKLTQSYCEEKIEDTSKSLASILRTINPLINGKQIFDYEKIGYLTLTKWNLPEEEYYADKVIDLFNKQLLEKKQIVKTSETKSNGRILVSEYQCSITDGASEDVAQGMIDIYDLSPIDTWFYIDNKNNLLFSWIPEKYISLIDQAVLVNCVEILNWMDTEYKELYLSIFGQESIVQNFVGSSLTNQNVKEKKRNWFWEIFKK